MIGLVGVGIICMTVATMYGLSKGHDGAILGLCLSLVSGTVASVVTYYKTRSKYRKERKS